MPIASTGSGTESRLQQVGTEKVIPLNPPSSKIDQLATDMILLGLKTLSQRTLCAISQSFTLCTTISAFVLWYRTLPNPTAEQLVGLALYATFLLALEVVRRRK